MSWLFSRALVAEYSAENCSAGEPSAPLSLMPTPQPFLLSDKTMAFSTPSQFGLTCRPLTGIYGVELLTLYLAASPARTFPQQGKARASTASDPACGWLWPASFAKYDPASRSWRTRQCSLLEGLAAYSETWPRWGSMLDGECSVLPTPAHLTSESESGLWPTPKASAAGPDFAKLNRSKTGISLPTAVALYPTPRSTDGDRGGRGDLIQAVRGNENSHFRLWQTSVADDSVERARGKVNSRGEPKLSAQVKQWPTPHGFSKDGRSNGPSGNELGRAVNRRTWPTPNASDNRDRGNLNSPCIQRRIEKGKQIGLSMAAGGSLNPPWVEWLMGWPIEWTALNPLATDRFQQWRLSHGAR